MYYPTQMVGRRKSGRLQAKYDQPTEPMVRKMTVKLTGEFRVVDPPKCKFGIADCLRREIHTKQGCARCVREKWAE